MVVTYVQAPRVDPYKDDEDDGYLEDEELKEAIDQVYEDEELEDELDAYEDEDEEYDEEVEENEY
jgi:hypothetical protein